ncbi:TetR/AcrR family transcriptional regulator C-terminal ligand-binding domain-containing protein [Pseudomonas entomophila]|uniref:TetR/AcrR family transcriptional regulator n=1 Tax=Pseudomonas entomophila TaxID=312306 RepID=UPI0023D7FA17|nr:TetR/AcrR family transcriptional regulator [Pseudomonas entomophila]MDF0729809.1 TetR/AcrR family transcriptional regulator C-terminal ligand-binding domain-containing protein [Pseudomonas entomophila]
MAINQGVRPGGRSARVQASVHKAVSELLEERERGELTVPLIAARAGVTPSTIYRRWGDLNELLGDVALQRIRPDGEPADTGSLKGDLLAWGIQYMEETASVPGRAVVLDLLAAGGGCSGRCLEIASAQFGILLARAVARGEPVPEKDRIVDRLVAPLVYRILFSSEELEAGYVEALVDGVLEGVPG